MSNELNPSNSRTSDNTNLSENSTRGHELAQQLFDLQQENLVVGKQNQELALQFHEASTYNQALGFDLYQLDQEITRLEMELEEKKREITEMDKQTKMMNEKADECKNLLLKDSEFSTLARKLRQLQKTHKAASDGLTQLKDLLGDPQFSMLDGALQLMQEKVHFLYWSNTELHQQIELMQQLLNEGNDGTNLEEDLEKLNDISQLKLEYYEDRLYELRLKQKNAEGNKISTKEIIKDSNGNLFEKEKVYDPKTDSYKINMRPLTKDGLNRKYRHDSSSGTKDRHTRVQNADGDEYEYEYQYDEGDEERKSKKKIIDPTKEEIKRIDGQEEDSEGFIKNIRTGVKSRVVKGQDNDFYLDLSDKKGKQITRRKIKADGTLVKEKDETRRKRIRHKGKDDNPEEEEYELEYNNYEDNESKKEISSVPKNKEIIDPIGNKQKRKSDKLEHQKLQDNEFDLTGFNVRRNEETGELEKYRRFKYGDDKEYEDVIYNLDGETIIKRNELDKRGEGYKHSKKQNRNTGRIYYSRHERILKGDENEYEYEYEYEENNDDSNDELEFQRHRVSEKKEVIPRFHNQEDADGFKLETRVKPNGKKVTEKVRRLTGKDGNYYKDTMQTNSATKKVTITRHMTRSQSNDALVYQPTKTSGRITRHSRIHHQSTGNETEYEYEYDNTNEGEKVLLSRSCIIDKANEIIPPILLKSELRRQRRDEQGFKDEIIDGPKSIRSRKVKGTKNRVYEDKLETNLNDGTQHIYRRQMDGDKLHYKTKKGKKLRRVRVQNDNLEEYEYEYEYDADKDTKTKKRVPKEQENIDEIGEGPIQDFIESVDPKTGQKILTRSTPSNEMDDVMYQDIISLNDEGEPIVTRRILSKDNKDGEYKYAKKAITDENGNKKNLRVRRSKVQYPNGFEEEFEYEYDDEAKTKTRSLIPKKDETIEAITNVPKKERTQKLLSNSKPENKADNYGYKEIVDNETGRRKKVRLTSNENGLRFEYTKEPDIQTKLTRTTRRRINPDDNAFFYEKVPSKRKTRTRKSLVTVGDSEREYQYEYDDIKDKVKRTQLPKRDKDGFFVNSNKRTIVDNKGIEYTDVRDSDKIFRRPSRKQPGYPHTRVRNLKTDEEYEYEYQEQTDDKNPLKKLITDIKEETIPIITLNSKPRKERIGPNFEMHNGRLIRRVNEYEDERIGFTIKRSKIDKKGNKIYKKDRYNNMKRSRRVLILDANDAQETEYEYTYDDTNEIPDKQRSKVDSNEIESILEKTGFTFQTGADNKIRLLRSIKGNDGSKYQDEGNTNKRRIIRRKMASNNSYVYTKDSKGRKNRYSRVKTFAIDGNDREYEYEYEYDYDNEAPKRTKCNTNNIEAINQQTGKRYISDKIETKEIENPLTGKPEEITLTKQMNDEYVIDPSTDKEMTVKKDDKYYSAVFKPDGKKKTIRSRKIKLNNNDQLLYEYDDTELDENGKPKRTVREYITIDHVDPDKDGFCLQKNGMRTRRIKGKDGLNYLDTIENHGKIRRRVVLSEDSEQLIYKKRKNKILRHSRSHEVNGNETEYEYEYDNEEDSDPSRKIVSKENEFEIEIICPNEFIQDQFNPSIKRRTIQGKDGQLYEDLLEGEKIERRPLERNGKNRKTYQEINGPRRRRTRVRNEKGDEFEFEYEDDTKKLVDPNNEIIARIDGMPRLEGGFIEQYDVFNNSILPNKKRQIRKVQAKNGQIYEDELVNPTTIKRRPLNRKGKISYKKDGNKTIRRQRVLRKDNENETEYEVEYEYNNETDERTKKKIDNRDAILLCFAENGNQDYVNDEIIEEEEADEDYADSDGFHERRNEETGELEKYRRFKYGDDKEYEDVIYNLDGETIIKRNELDKRGEGYKHSKKQNRNTGRIYYSRHERILKGDEIENEYEYEYEENGDQIQNRHLVETRKEQIPHFFLDNEFEGFNRESTTNELGEKKMALVRRSVGKNGQHYKDTIENENETGKLAVKRVVTESNSNDNLAYSTDQSSGQIVRRQRIRHLSNDKDNEYEYEYNTDAGGHKIDDGNKQRIKDKSKETIEEIRLQRKQIPSQTPGSPYRLPMALYQSEDQRPQLEQSNPSVLQKSKIGPVDLTEQENKANLDKNSPLAALIKKLREENGFDGEEGDLTSPEYLQRVLAELEKQIQDRTAVRDNLKDQIADLESPGPTQKKSKKKSSLEMTKVRTMRIEAPPNPLKVLALNDHGFRSTSSQTEVTSETINYQQNVLDKQRREKNAAVELRDSLESLKAKIKSLEEKIENAKEDGQMKETRIKALKIEISNIKDELIKEDKNVLREEQKSREYARQLAELDDQIRQKQQQLEKVNSQVGALHMNLKEMQRFRVILESELNDLVNREKPEIRQLIDDVKSYRIQIEISNQNVETMTGKVEAKRKQLQNLLNSDEINLYNEMKMKKMNLERRIKKWTLLMKDSKETLQSLEVFSAKNASVRKSAVDEYKNKTRLFLRKEMELDDLEKYYELVESMIKEHKQNWM